MKRMTYAIAILITLWACAHKKEEGNIEYKFAVANVDSGLNKWYTVKEQFVSIPNCKGNKKYASIFISNTDNSDKPLIILGPCQNSEFELNSSAMLFKAQEIKVGDTLILKAPVNIIDKLKIYPVIVGSLKIPIE